MTPDATRVAAQNNAKWNDEPNLEQGGNGHQPQTRTTQFNARASRALTYDKRTSTWHELMLGHVDLSGRQLSVHVRRHLAVTYSLPRQCWARLAHHSWPLRSVQFVARPGGSARPCIASPDPWRRRLNMYHAGKFMMPRVIRERRPQLPPIAFCALRVSSSLGYQSHVCPLPISGKYSSRGSCQSRVHG